MYEDDGYYITEDGYEKAPQETQKIKTDWKFIIVVAASLTTTLFVAVPWVIGVAAIVRTFFF